MLSSIFTNFIYYAEWLVITLILVSAVVALIHYVMKGYYGLKNYLPETIAVFGILVVLLEVNVMMVARTNLTLTRVEETVRISGIASSVGQSFLPDELSGSATSLDKYNQDDLTKASADAKRAKVIYSILSIVELTAGIIIVRNLMKRNARLYSRTPHTSSRRREYRSVRE